MSLPTAHPPDPITVRCPTCRATQEWSDTCRRCRSDLRLLRACATSYAQARRACLQHLQAGHWEAAQLAARQCHALAPTPESQRWLALAALRLGHWSEARSLGQAML